MNISRMRYRIIAYTVAFLTAVNGFAAERFVLFENGGRSSLLLNKGETVGVFVDSRTEKGVMIAAKNLCNDIRAVCGANAVITDDKSNAVICIATTPDGKWEEYRIKVGQKQVTITGSDKRGTIYGIYELSRQIGVSPWYWWADVPVVHHDRIYLKRGSYTDGEPSVQYRGIFINDERYGGWAPWAEKNFDKETGKVGPKTYEKVFELLLRLKANYLWPAMHNGTKAFNHTPENARLADEYGIVMGSSHCEQMLRNNEDEWKNVGTYGDFNYVTNRQTMIDYWEARVKTNGQYENIYTLGLRGIHDYPMEGASTTEERVKLMQQAINDQRDILSRNINKPVKEIPQILCTYEEVLDAYHHGLQIPDDVTMLWADDKHGYTRNLCNPEEQKRKGGAGIYYHISYHGDPVSWIWLSPLSPAFISTELTKAYEFGARKIWIFNVGDIKPAEKEISFAMDLAWDINRWKPAEAHRYIREWAAQTFGEQFADEIAAMQDTYYKLQASGKDSHVYFVEYSQEQIDSRLAGFRTLTARAEQLQKIIPEAFQDAYFELVLYPIKGAMLMNEYQLLARCGMVRAAAGDSLALEYSENVRRAFDELNRWTYKYNNEIAGGKWNYFFDWRPFHWRKSSRIDVPLADGQVLLQAISAPAHGFLSASEASGENGVDIEAATDGTVDLWIRAVTPIRNFSRLKENNVFCHVCCGEDSFDASAVVIDNVWHATMLGPMWSKVGTLHLTKGSNTLRITDLKPEARIDSIFIGVWPPFAEDYRQRIEAKDFVSRHKSVALIRQLGYTDGLLVQPFGMPSYDEKHISDAPFAEYEIELHKGINTIEIRTLPTLHVYEGRDARYAIQVKGHPAETFSIHTDDFCAEWRRNVVHGYASRSIEISSDVNGKVPLRFSFLDPGIVLQEILVK